MTEALTPPERETMVNACDADDFVTVWSAQRKVITRLRKLACAELLEEGHYGTSAWAKFKLPVGALSFRTPLSAEQREQRRQQSLAHGSFDYLQRTPSRADRNLGGDEG